MFVPHTAVLGVRALRRRLRGHASPAPLLRPASGARRPFTHGAAVAFLVGRGLDPEAVLLGSIQEQSLRFAEEVIERHATEGPLRALHVGNFVGVSLAALSDVLFRRDPGSVVVSIDPNLPHLGIEDLQGHVMALLDHFGLLGSNVVVCGYSLERAVSTKKEGVPALPASENTLAALSRLDQRFDLVLVDGNHDADYLRRELDAILPLLSRGGILILDDVSRHHEPVRRVYEELLADEARSVREVGRDERLGILLKESGTRLA